MSMDFTGRESDKPITDQEGVMFAAQPVWERNRKRKGFGSRKTASAAPIDDVTPEPRTFAAERDDEEPMALDRPLDAPITSTPVYPRTEYAAMGAAAPTRSTLAADEPVGLAAPISGTRNTRSAKSNSVAPAAIAAAVVGLGALGAAGWYMSRDTSGVPELAAGSTATTSELAAAPLTPVDPPAQVAVNEAAPPPAVTPPAPPPRVETARAPAQATARARPRPATAAPSAASAGVNASTTTALPDGPQPYAPSPGTTAPTQVNPPLVTLPPTSEAPAATPATPPTLPQEAPATQAPTPDPVTPPQ